MGVCMFVRVVGCDVADSVMYVETVTQCGEGWGNFGLASKMEESLFYGILISIYQLIRYKLH